MKLTEIIKNTLIKTTTAVLTPIAYAYLVLGPTQAYAQPRETPGIEQPAGESDPFIYCNELLGDKKSEFCKDAKILDEKPEEKTRWGVNPKCASSYDSGMCMDKDLVDSLGKKGYSIKWDNDCHDWKDYTQNEEEACPGLKKCCELPNAPEPKTEVKEVIKEVEKILWHCSEDNKDYTSKKQYESKCPKPKKVDCPACEEFTIEGPQMRLYIEGGAGFQTDSGWYGTTLAGLDLELFKKIHLGVRGGANYEQDNQSSTSPITNPRQSTSPDGVNQHVTQTTETNTETLDNPFYQLGPNLSWDFVSKDWGRITARAGVDWIARYQKSVDNFSTDVWHEDSQGTVIPGTPETFYNQSPKNPSFERKDGIYPYGAIEAALNINKGLFFVQAALEGGYDQGLNQGKFDVKLGAGIRWDLFKKGGKK
jgi:hypothetical protein